MKTRLEEAEELLKQKEELAKKHPDSFAVQFDTDSFRRHVEELRDVDKTNR